MNLLIKKILINLLLSSIILIKSFVIDKVNYTLKPEEYILTLSRSGKVVPYIHTKPS